MVETRTRQTGRRSSNDRPRLMWLALLAPIVVLAGIVAASVTFDQSPESTGGPAPDFVLPSTGGDEISLTDLLADGDAMLYFSMGVGCDGCFLQIPEIKGTLEHLDIRLVPIMVDAPDLLAIEAARLGISDPIFVDRDRSVSHAYGMLGQYGHGDTPSHSFALVTQDREITWVRHYAEMFVPLNRFVADLPETIP